MRRRRLSWLVAVSTIVLVLCLNVSPSGAAGKKSTRFAAARGYAVPTVPVAVDIVDMTGDGLPDMISASTGTMVSLVRNRGHRSFAPALNVSTGSNGEYLKDDVVSDLNQDGFPDVASVSFNLGRGSAGTVSVLINDAGHGFDPPVLYLQEENPTSIAAGDVDGDGDPDLAVTLLDLQTGNFEIGIMANAGDGTFGSPVIYPAPRSNGPSELLDVNGDGPEDLVVLDQNSSVLGVLLGDGHGAFGTEVIYPTGITAVSLAVGDMNHDERPDAVIGGVKKGAFLANNGNGTFGPPSSLDLGAGGLAYVAVTDLQGDGNPDIAAASSGGWVTPLLGHGDGTFRRGQRFAAGSGGGLTGGDLDLDGRQDLAVIGNHGTIAPLFGAKGGRFLAAPVMLLAKASPEAGALAATDLSGDSLPDLTIGGGSGGSHSKDKAALSEPGLFVSLNQGGGRFGPSTPYQLPWGPTGIATGDFNEDGIVDMAASLGANDTQNLAILLGTGAGGLEQPSLISVVNFPADIVTGDFNGDAHLDIGLAIFNSGTQTTQVTVLPGAGDGTFGPPLTTNLGPDEPLGISADHLDGGPTLDVVLLVQNAQGTNQASVIAALGTGSGTFSNTQKYGVGEGRGELATADLDNDGIPDVVASVPDDNAVATLLGVGDGTFAPGPAASVGTSPHWLALGDFTNEGTPDLVVADGAGLLWSLRGVGDGTFGPPLSYVTSEGPLAAADLDGNDTLDVAETQTSNLSVSLFLGFAH